MNFFIFFLFLQVPYFLLIFHKFKYFQRTTTISYYEKNFPKKKDFFKCTHFTMTNNVISFYILSYVIIRPKKYFVTALTLASILVMLMYSKNAVAKKLNKIELRLTI